MITITKDINKAQFITHAGNFHADDVFSSVFLSKLYGEITLIRLADYKEEGSKIAFDIGLGKYDHHQRGFDKKRTNGIHYCSFGLLWQDLGLKYLKKINIINPEETWQIFDYLLVNMIDAIDNGELEIQKEFNIYTISTLIELFRPKFDEEKGEDESFLEACEFAEKIFDLVLKEAESKTKTIEIIKEKSKNMKDKILVLDKFIPFEFAIFKLGLDVDFVVYPSNRGGYASRTISTHYKGYTPKVPFKKEWAGLRDEELARVSSIPSAKFCHNNLFLFTAGNLEDAIKASKLSISKEE